MDCIIGGRFHSIILSMITSTPFIALYSTTKLHNLMIESPEFSRFFIKTDLDNIDTVSIYNNLEYISRNKLYIISQLKEYSLTRYNSLSTN
jgi:polysaccharide pyruvyl transferase WcaK-like protein